MPSDKTSERILEYARGIDGIDLKILGEGLEIKRLHHRLDQAIENDVGSTGLAARQVEVLEVLYHNADQTLTPADLADQVGLTRSAMTGALDSLERAKHVVRAAHPSDRRMVALSLTASGWEFISSYLPERYRRMHRVLSALTQAERRTLLRAYGKLLDVLAAMEAEDGE